MSIPIVSAISLNRSTHTHLSTLWVVSVKLQTPGLTTPNAWMNQLDVRASDVPANIT